MTTLYCGHYLVPVTSPVLERAAIAVTGGKIVAIGSAADMKARYPQAPCQDFADAIILPAFVNAHTHLELSHYAQWAVQAGETSADKYANFVEWILRLIRTKIALKLDEQAYLKSWNYGHKLAISTGTGYFGDILSVSGIASEVAAKLSGCTFIEILGRDAIRVNKQLYDLDHCVNSWPQSNWGAAPHSPYTISAELLKQCYRYTKCKHLRSTIHLAESADEVEFLFSGSGAIAAQLYSFVGWQNHLPLRDQMRPLQFIAQAGGLNADSLLVHGVHLNRDEIAAVAQAGCSMVLCPRSNSILNVGVAPVTDYIDAGVPMALATDSLASNRSLSLWDEMEFARDWFSGDLSPEQLLSMCTTGGARALFGAAALTSKVGQLAVGAPASFQVLQPKALPAKEDIYPFLCSGQRGAEVQSLVVNGKVCYSATVAIDPDNEDG
ncbi:MAG: amidohydrolase family protein [Desulfuromonas sp.]|nr:amidohydrolase family protein [Desulfuromonas sp.]